MLVPLKESDFAVFVEQAYEMALIPEITSYPVYYDGIKTKEDYIERAGKAFGRDDESILLFYKEDIFCGWIHYYYLADDQYLDTVSLSARTGTEQMLGEFLDFVEGQYPDAMICLGFPQENVTALTYLQSRGFVIGEQSWNMALHLSGTQYMRSRADSILRIDKENYSLFQGIHSQCDGDMYWDTEHIFKDLDNWMVFVALWQGRPAGAVYCRKGSMAEIFGIDFVDGIYVPDVQKELLNVVISACCEDGSRDIVYFCGDIEKSALMDAGFYCIGKYIMVERRKLPPCF